MGGHIRGHFKNGRVDGLAEITFKDLSCYQGFWRDGNFHGLGKKRKVQSGEFVPVCYSEGRRVPRQSDCSVQRMSVFDRETFVRGVPILNVKKG